MSGGGGGALWSEFGGGITVGGWVDVNNEFVIVKMLKKKKKSWGIGVGVMWGMADLNQE